jgi:hypothetical protein
MMQPTAAESKKVCSSFVSWALADPGLWTPLEQPTVWTIDKLSASDVARGDSLIVTGSLGIAGGSSVVALERNGRLYKLDTVRWACGAAEVSIPNSVPAGRYNVRFQTRSSHALPLTVL